MDGAADSRDGTEARLAALMRAAQAGDGAAYAALLRGVVPVVRAVARGQGVTPGALDDVVQDVLLTLHRARHTWDPHRPFMPWLRTIAQRRAIDGLRGAGRVGAREVHAPVAAELHPDPAPPPGDALDRGKDVARLREAVAALPPGQRQAVELLAFQERTLEEAASATGRTKVALKVNLHRALKALRLRLGADE